MSGILFGLSIGMVILMDFPLQQMHIWVGTSFSSVLTLGMVVIHSSDGKEIYIKRHRNGVYLVT